MGISDNRSDPETYLRGESLDSAVPLKILDSWDRAVKREEYRDRFRTLHKRTHRLRQEIEKLIADAEAIGLDGVRVFEASSHALWRAEGELQSLVPESATDRPRGRQRLACYVDALNRGVDHGRTWQFVAAVLYLSVPRRAPTAWEWPAFYDAVEDKHNKAVVLDRARGQILRLLILKAAGRLTG